ncbi:hypothetical protein BJV40_004195 [Clostridium beijerinckii]|nr:hypothetical protein [Clostridium beijerinckii]
MDSNNGGLFIWIIMKVSIVEKLLLYFLLAKERWEISEV